MQKQCWCKGHVSSQASTGDPDCQHSPLKQWSAFAAFFFGFTNPIFPFLYASNVGDGAWKCPFVSEFALGRPCDAGWQQSHSTGGFWRGILHISISWQKKLFHVRMHPPISKHTQMMSVSWRLVSSCKNSQFPTFLCSFPCLSLLSLERSAIQGWVIILFYKIITTVCCNFSAFTWHLHECSASLWNSHTHLFFFLSHSLLKLHRFWVDFPTFQVGFVVPGFLPFHWKPKQIFPTKRQINQVESSSLKSYLTSWLHVSIRVAWLKVLPLTFQSSHKDHDFTKEVCFALLPCLEFRQLKILHFPFWGEVTIGRRDGKHSVVSVGIPGSQGGKWVRVSPCVHDWLGLHMGRSLAWIHPASNRRCL